MDADPLTIGGLTFTGASIILRHEAAYHTTSLAASAAKPDVVLVHPVLLKALKKAGFDRCDGEGDHLSEEQLAAVMADKTIAQRIELKQMADLAGIMPAGR
jgi:hypothetical protein